jgi:hypothetical protein
VMIEPINMLITLLIGWVVNNMSHDHVHNT